MAFRGRLLVVGCVAASTIALSEAEAARPRRFPTPTPLPTEKVDDPDPKSVDLVVTDLDVNADCNIVAKLKNQGNIPIPDSIQDVSIQFYRDGSPAGGRTLASGQLGDLRPPGGTTTLVLPTFKVDGEPTIKARIDSLNAIVEVNEANNTRSEVLKCSPKLPDLDLSITTNSQCRKVITVKNVGAGVPIDATWASVNELVERRVDGMILHGLSLGTVDPDRKLRTPGAKVSWVEPIRYRAYQSFDYELKYQWQEEAETNNRVSSSVPAACKGTRPAYDLQPVGLTIDEKCRVIVTVRNNGPGPAPPARAGVVFYKDGVRRGSWTADLLSLTSAGSTVTVHGPKHDTGWTAGTWRVVVDSANRLSESNEGNNAVSKTLKCAPAVKAPSRIAPSTKVH